MNDLATAVSAAALAYPAAPASNRAAGWNDTGTAGVPLHRDSWQWLASGN